MKVSKKQNLQNYKTFSLTTPQTTKVQGGEGGGMIELMPLGVEVDIDNI